MFAGRGFGGGNGFEPHGDAAQDGRQQVEDGGGGRGGRAGDEAAGQPEEGAAEDADRRALDEAEEDAAGASDGGAGREGHFEDGAAVQPRERIVVHCYHPLL